MSTFLGIDVAGASATWSCQLSRSGVDSWHASTQQSTLASLLEDASEGSIGGVAIDAQLTWSREEEKGFRSCDLELQSLVPDKNKNWVASQNSLMAVPTRGRQLAELLSPYVGTVIETHPRACLYLWRPDLLPQIRSYKGKSSSRDALCTLWSTWLEAFNIAAAATAERDDELDALVCATVAAQYHHAPDTLRRLRHEADDARGHGPFVVIAPHAV